MTDRKRLRRDRRRRIKQARESPLRAERAAAKEQTKLDADYGIENPGPIPRTKKECGNA